MRTAQSHRKTPSSVIESRCRGLRGWRQQRVSEGTMERVSGIGGIFFKSKDPMALRDWYRKNLGVDAKEELEGAAVFSWADTSALGPGQTYWAPFPSDTNYFDPSRASFMINFRVSSLAAMLEQLRDAGVEVIGDVEEHDYGRFGWIFDPEGSQVDCW